MDKITARLRDWKQGDPLDPAKHIGCLIDAEHAAKVRSFIDDDATHNFVRPYIFQALHDDPRNNEEIFGPVLSVFSVSSDDDAIALANDSNFGLSASVFTAHSRKAIRAAHDIKAGTVTVNCNGEGDISTPFGGYKQFSFGGRDNGLAAHEQYTELKTIWIDLSDPKDGDNGG